MDPPIIGRTLSHYRIVGEVGGGGMGVVFRAEDTTLGRTVAIKMLPASGSDRRQAERLRREARAASALNHPNICTVHEIGHDDTGQPFIVMELLEGQNLRNAIGGKPIETARLLELALEIVDGLRVAHGKGIVHRDLKPSNIFLMTNGHVKILDFGLAKFDPPAGAALSGVHASTITDIKSLTRDGITVGTVGYMSPEQVRGEPLDARSDLFSVGLVLYEMATGRQAFS